MFLQKQEVKKNKNLCFIEKRSCSCTSRASNASARHVKCEKSNDFAPLLRRGAFIFTCGNVLSISLKQEQTLGLARGSERAPQLTTEFFYPPPFRVLRANVLQRCSVNTLLSPSPTSSFAGFVPAGMSCSVLNTQTEKKK